jgi:hypothetical protein
MTRFIPPALTLAFGTLFSLLANVSAAPNPVIPRLLDPATRMDAFFEAALIHEGLVDELAVRDRRIFSEFCQELDITVCPQGQDDTANLYLVTYRPNHEATRPSRIRKLERNYPRDHDQRLFTLPSGDPPNTKTPPGSGLTPPLTPSLEPRIDRAFVVFDNAGEVVEPLFPGNDTTNNAVVFDLNGDGILEWLEPVRFAVGGTENQKRPEILTVRSIQKQPETLFAVIYNWHRPEEAPANDWGFKLANLDNDRRVELHLGPLTATGIEPKVAFRWDDSAHTWTGPSGGRGEHFKVLDATASLEDQVSALWRLGGLKYRLYDTALSPEPEAVPPTPAQAPDDSLVIHHNDDGPVYYDPDKHTAPYRYESLKKLSHQELLDHMGRGRTIQDLRNAQRSNTRLPRDFWSLSPKDAALRYAEANRSDQHRQRFQLAVDDLDAIQPPPAGSIHFVEKGAGGAARQFLRYDPGPGPSYLVNAQDNMIIEKVAHLYLPSGPPFSLSLKELDDSLAQHLFEIIWWLDRIRSHRTPATTDDPADSAPKSATPGLSTAALGNQNLVLTFSDPANGASSSTREGGTPVGGLADVWSGDYNHDVFLELTRRLLINEIPAYLEVSQLPPQKSPSKDDVRRQNLGRLSRILELWENGASDFPEKIAGDAIATAGQLGLVELLPTLQQINKERALTKFEFDNTTKSVFEEKSFHEKLTVALAQLEIADNPDELEALARENSPASGWAALQLRETHPQRYRAALEHWLTITSGPEQRQVYETLLQTSASAGQPLPDALPGMQSPELSVATLEILLKQTESPALDAHVSDVVTKLADDEAWNDPQTRLRAIRLLVPLDDPFRHSDPSIDEALITIAKSSTNVSLRHSASLALALRLEQDAWNVLWRPFAAAPDSNPTPHPGIGERPLEALSYVAAKKGPPYRDEILNLVRANLASADLQLPWLFHTAFELDLRELQPDLERLATSGPDDSEGDFNGAWRANSTSPHRFHLPRKILAIWNEEDPATRTKLLLAYGVLENRGHMEDYGIATRLRLDQELEKLATSLSFDQKLEAIDFINWLEENARERLAPSNRSLGPRQLAFLSRNRERLLP